MRLVLRSLLLPVLLALTLLPLAGPPGGDRKPDMPPIHEVADAGGALPDNTKMERLAKEDPVAFLESCLRRYGRTVKGYTCTLQKQERLNGKLERREEMEVAFREQPFSVYLRWLQNARLADCVLYVAGENGDKLLVKPAGLLSLAGVVERDVDGPQAKQSGRYTIKQFGLKRGAQRTLADWEVARKAGALHVEFLGKRKIKELDDRECWVLKRDRYARPEADGVTEVTIYVDTETWLQVGIVLKGEEGKLIGEYLFRDVKLNPDFKADQFTRKALTQ